ncbi:Spo75p NDAI_0C02460 [Naumovozyma dairenensis CBS 421]|uniref:CSC1/OSCA1-like 7TM region domain-containing protein n=1 Tax=Naumovozyma dairenensis (strain ATCC 10597 / BCRC 20456 / CBS 421 / NBRC 0211 / NRRL Y-12639) TaxID=1071378 RepID=G0W7Z5_NAUDC|nr:hypothetical protein NDAI_0C02460 [Naumovozyma dairenensis CBS 421]CCD23906.1 hypothetical protein NDAI_0C02460 [Naumovozyma dairenensis CBS 421]
MHYTKNRKMIKEGTYRGNRLNPHFDFNSNNSQLVINFNPIKNPSSSSTKNFTSSIISRFLNNTRTGSAHRHVGITLQRFLSGILLSVIFLAFQILLFLFLRTKLKSIYQANRVLKLHEKGQEDDYGKDDSGTPWGDNTTKTEKKTNWASQLFMASDEIYKKKCGLDAYFLLRFLKFLIFFFFILSLVHIPILIPLHLFSNDQNMIYEDYDRKDDKLDQLKSHLLDKLNMSNIIPPAEPNILIIHLILGVFVISWFHIMLNSELSFTTGISTQEILKDKYQTVLYVDNVPKDMGKIMEHFSLIGSIRDVQFLSRDTKKYYTIWKRMCSIQEKIETIIMEIMLEKFFKSTRKPKGWKMYRFYWNKLIFFSKTSYRLFNFRIRLKWKDSSKIIASHYPSWEIEKQSFIENRYNKFQEVLAKYNKISEKWEKEYYQLETGHQNFITSNRHANPDAYLEKVFIQFDTVETAHVFGQLLLFQHHKEWNNVVIGPNPNDIRWSNITRTNSYAIFLRSVAANILSILTIIGWIIPVGLIGLISQIPYLRSPVKLPSVIINNTEFINDMLMSIFSVMTLVFLTEVVPYIFRWFSLLKVCKTGVEIQIDIQRWFFIFLFVHIFLVVTISSGLSFIIESLVNNPVSIPSLLAHDLPKSSNFLCSFVLMRGLAYAGGNIIRMKELLCELLYYKPFIYTPHKRFERLKTSLSFQWGAIYPIFSVIGCIGIIYSVIAPVILPMCCVSFSLVYISFKYLFEFQYNNKNKSETFGKLYPQALMQLYAGIYCMEICLMGLFAISNGYKLSFCMLLIFVSTIIIQYKISTKHLSQLNHLPLYYIKNSAKLDVRSREVEHLCNLKDYEIPLINACKKYDEIWILNDGNGIGEIEQDNLERNYDIVCNSERYFINSSGDIYLNDL